MISETRLTERWLVPLSAASQIAMETLKCSPQDGEQIVEICIRQQKTQVKIFENGKWRYLKDDELATAKIDVPADFIGVGPEIVELEILTDGDLLGDKAQDPVDGGLGKAHCSNDARLYRPDFTKFLDEIEAKPDKQRSVSGSREGIGGRKPKYDRAEITGVAALELHEKGFPAGYNAEEFFRRVFDRLIQGHGYDDDPEDGVKALPSITTMKEWCGPWMPIFEKNYD